MMLFSHATQMVIALAESLTNRALLLDPATEHKLEKLDNNSILIKACEPKVTLLIRIKDKKIQLSNNELPADAVIEGRCERLVALLLNPQDRTGGDLRFSGDLILINQLEQIIRELDIDWYEPLSYVLGDTITHRIEIAQSKTLDWIAKTSKKMMSNTEEYLNNEQTWLSTSQDLNEFKHALDETRMLQARIQARIDRLNQCIAIMPPNLDSA